MGAMWQAMVCAVARCTGVAAILWRALVGVAAWCIRAIRTLCCVIVGSWAWLLSGDGFVCAGWASFFLVGFRDFIVAGILAPPGVVGQFPIVSAMALMMATCSLGMLSR